MRVSQVDAGLYICSESMGGKGQSDRLNPNFGILTGGSDTACDRNPRHLKPDFCRARCDLARRRTNFCYPARTISHTQDPRDLQNALWTYHGLGRLQTRNLSWTLIGRSTPTCSIMASPLVLGLGLLATGFGGRAAYRYLTRGGAQQFVRGGFKAKMDESEALQVLGLR